MRELTIATIRNLHFEEPSISRNRIIRVKWEELTNEILNFHRIVYAHHFVGFAYAYMQIITQFYQEFNLRL